MPLPIIAAIPGLVKAGLGIYQTIRGSRMNPKRPTYEIPGQVGEELAMSRQEAYGRMPGALYAQDRINENTASGQYALQRGVTNSSQLLSGIAQLQMQRNIASRGLMESEANDSFRRTQNLRRSLGVMATYKDKQFQLNKMEPYQDAARTKAALIQSGLINSFSGLGEAGSSMMMADYRNKQQQSGIMPEGYNRYDTYG